MLTELGLVIIGGAKFGAIYALAAMGLVVVHKATKTVNFAHGALVMLGAFGSYLVVVRFSWPYWVAYLVMPLIIGCMSAAMEFLILRPLRRADLFTVVIATVFLGIALAEAFRLIYNTEMLAVPGVFSGPPFLIGGIIITREALWVTAGALAAGFVCILIFMHGTLGRGMRAMASNLRGAQLCGYSVDRVYLFVWFLGGAVAGLTGVFVAPIKGVSTDLSVSIIAAAFVAGVVGGFDSLKGAIVGGLLLGLAESLAAAYVSSAFKNAVSFILLFFVLLWRPEGLFPERIVRRV